MTYTYHCESCGFNHSFSEDGGGMKNSCCHNCSNPECPDHGECNCFEEWWKKQREMLDKLIEEDPERFARNLVQRIERAEEE